jgi:hypothetical protein
MLESCIILGTKDRVEAVLIAPSPTLSEALIAQEFSI